jgi:RNA polymerase sigma-70 factor (ECF subfamily)
LSEHESLLARAAAGDREAFREVYIRHRSDVTRLVFRMLGPRPDAEDVIQEVFFQVFRSLKDFRGQSKFTTWLHRVTVNVVLMHRRAAKSRPVFADEPIQDGQINAESVLPDEDFARRERMRAFARLLDRLAEKKRVVFILHELEGLAPAEIAKIVGAPVLTVRTRLFYARRELEGLLAEEPTLAGVLRDMQSGRADPVEEPKDAEGEGPSGPAEEAEAEEAQTGGEAKQARPAGKAQR